MTVDAPPSRFDIWRVSKCVFLILFLSGALSRSTLANDDPHFPFPQHVHSREDILHPKNFTQAEQDEDVTRFYDYWKKTYLVREAESPAAWRVAFGKQGRDHGKTVSEGQGYGMVITVLMAGHDPEAREIFDGLWRFARMHPSSIEPRLMAWEIISGNPKETDSAFDGDADIADALLLADRQWGSTGEINYHEAALGVIAGIKDHTIGPQSYLPLLGDWVREGSKYNQWQTRPSDFMIGHFRAYGQATSDPIWEKVIAVTQATVAKLQMKYSPQTGLLPDFVVSETKGEVDPTSYDPSPAPPKFLEAKTDGFYNYNACRVPWRLGADAILNDDKTSLEQARKISLWIEKATDGDPQKIHAGYELDGSPLPHSDYFSSAFASPFGVAAMCQPTQQKWLDEIYASVRQLHDDYYQDSVTLLCLLVMTGNSWEPTQTFR